MLAVSLLRLGVDAVFISVGHFHVCKIMGMMNQKAERVCIIGANA